MLSKLAIRRLTKLADFMDALPPEARKHFDMGLVIHHNGEHEVKSVERALRRFDCGTAACALGWASTIPEFRRDGINFTGDYGIDLSGASEYFGDGINVYEDLFSGYTPVTTPKQWAKHCRKFIRDNAA